jgi:hypothetical protein
MKTFFIPGLVLLAVLLTGCARNYYEVQLIPRGDALERELTFYRAKGTDTNGVPAYQNFPEDQRAAIANHYPPDSLQGDGRRHVVRGQFAGMMPADIGGAGNWTNYTSSLGSAAIYAERFRGDDDFAATVEKRLAAADQLTDLLIGWSRTQLGHEPRYDNLHRFLTSDFRRDLKNLMLYNWARELSTTREHKGSEEFVARFAQYLMERGYFKLRQLPDFFAALTKHDSRAITQFIQRLVATKMGFPESEPLPECLAFLNDPAVVSASWEEYLLTTEAYQIRVQQWEGERKANPNLEKPKPSDVTGELFLTGLNFRMFSSDDQLTVKLTLPAAPIRTNGKWDAAARQVAWAFELDEAPQTPRVPAFCYASWSTANDSFQIEHFGAVILSGEELLQYCLAVASLSAKHAGDWEAFLASLKPDPALAEQIDAFRFTDESVATPAEPDAKTHQPSELPRELLKAAMPKAPRAAR